VISFFAQRIGDIRGCRSAPQRPGLFRIRGIKVQRRFTVSIGKWSFANPDFIERLKRGAPLNDPFPATFFNGGASGYNRMFDARSRARSQASQ
jgi:hypothetical protein